MDVSGRYRHASLPLTRVNATEWREYLGAPLASPVRGAGAMRVSLSVERVPTLSWAFDNDTGDESSPRLQKGFEVSLLRYSQILVSS